MTYVISQEIPCMKNKLILKNYLPCQPGETKRVSLVRIGGKQVIRGGNCIIDGPVDDTNITAVMGAERMVRFGHSDEAAVRS